MKNALILILMIFSGSSLRSQITNNNACEVVVTFTCEDNGMGSTPCTPLCDTTICVSGMGGTASFPTPGGCNADCGGIWYEIKVCLSDGNCSACSPCLSVEPPGGTCGFGTSTGSINVGGTCSCGNGMLDVMMTSSTSMDVN